MNFNFEHTQKIIFSPPVKKDDAKLTGRRIKIKNKDYMQFEHISNNQAFHENILIADLQDFFTEKILKYKQVNIFLTDAHYIAFNKSGIISFHKTKDKPVQIKSDEHNRSKNYIINEGDNIPALIELGIFTKDFKIINSMYNKFKQINRFAELFDDLSGKIDEIYKKYNKINVIDFGCGKSYLTFILYYYFINIKKIPEENLKITGVDLKKSVIDDCNNLTEKYKYKNLSFEVGDIKDYAINNINKIENINIVVSLHGCDLATDYALYNAVKWGADIIFAAPCCEHEINAQIDIKAMRNILKYGAAKERFSAVLTNSIRCNLLESQNYKTELIEFVDISHSPKNLLIRAVNINNCANRDEIKRELDETLRKFGVSQTLYNLLYNS